MKETIAIDFDGVLHHYVKFEEKPNGEPIRGAREALKIYSQYYSIVVFTCRSTARVRAWLRKYDMQQFVDHVTNRKPIASAYFDDNAVHVPKNQWEGLLEALDLWHSWNRIL